MFEKWFQDRTKEIIAEAAASADPLIAKEIEKAAATLAPLGKMLVDYIFLQLNGVGFVTQHVEKGIKPTPEEIEAGKSNR
jgi:hypothetical protein